MTPIQIAYFKHFLFDKGIQRIYISMYQQRRLRGDEKGDKSANPESIEQFFKDVHASKVIMKAFYFPINSDYGFDYWTKLNDQWKEYWDIHKENFSNDKYVTLKGTFAILRQNWDNREYWKAESKETTYHRTGIEPPPVKEDLETAFDVLSVKEPETVASEDIEEKMDSKENESQPGSLLDGFQMVESISNSYGVRRNILSNIVSVNLRNGGYRITFSIDVTEKLRKHKYEYVKYLTNPNTKEVAFIFNHQSGCNVSMSEHRNLTINSKAIVEHIHKFYNLKKLNDYFLLKITATINQDNSTIYKLKYKD